MTQPSENLLISLTCFELLMPKPTTTGSDVNLFNFIYDFFTKAIEGFFVPVIPIIDT